MRLFSLAASLSANALLADDDLAAMYLTSKAEGHTRDPSEHEEIELLLESFEKQCEEIVSEVDSLAVRPSRSSLSLLVFLTSLSHRRTFGIRRISSS